MSRKLVEAMLKEKLTGVNRSLTQELQNGDTLYKYKTDPGVTQLATSQRETLFELFRQTLKDVSPPSVLDQLSRQMVFLLYGVTIYAQTGRKGAAALDAWECARQLIDFASFGRVG